tara:strand:+ start:69 stop:503 length:435 start_codon:yes stop_codon:yes gene_type:complete
VISLKNIYAIINTLGAYTVATIADKLDPIFSNDLRKKRSATPTPIKPLIVRITKSLLEKLGKGTSKIKIVIIKPITPNEFFTIFICSGYNFFEDNSKRITAKDQHTAVSNAYRSPILCDNYFHLFCINKKAPLKGAFFLKGTKI